MLLHRCKGPSAMVVIHYFGWCAVSDCLRNVCSGTGTILIEDYAQALLTLASDGSARSDAAEVSIFSLNKFLPVCDTAAAFSRNPDLDLSLRHDTRVPTPSRVHRAYAAHLSSTRTLVNARYEDESKIKSLIGQVGATYSYYYSFLGPPIHDWKPRDSTTCQQFPPYDYGAVRRNRVRNIRLLYEATDWGTWLPLKQVIEPGVVPFAVAVRVPARKRNSIVMDLLRTGVWLGIMRDKWDFVPNGRREEFGVEARWLDEHVLVPIGEWIPPDRIIQMAEALNSTARRYP